MDGNDPLGSLLLKTFRCQELCLALSSYLQPHACWCLRATARNFFSEETAPIVHRALHMRQELCHLFTILEIVLSRHSSRHIVLEELRHAFDSSPMDCFPHEKLRQVIVESGLFEVNELTSEELALAQHRGDFQAIFQSFSDFYARFARFETILASQKECVSQESFLDQVRRFFSSASSPKRGRRLSRQSSITVPKNGCAQDLGKRMAVLQRARTSLSECEAWISTVSAAETARVVLENLFKEKYKTKGDVTIESVQRILTAQQSKFRCSAEKQHGRISAEQVPLALLLLNTKASGGLCIEMGRKHAHRNNLCFQAPQGLSQTNGQETKVFLVGTKRALQHDLEMLDVKKRRLASDAQHAFLATMQDTSASSESSGTQ